MISTSFTPPTIDHLARAYYELARIGAEAVGSQRSWPYDPTSREELLAICGELSRHDPRLFEILVNYLRVHWDTIDWLKFRRAVLQIPTPQAFGVIGALLFTATRSTELKNCFRFLVDGIRSLPTQFFYHHLYSPGSALAQRALDQRLTEFERWGFLTSERPIIHQATKQGVGRLSTAARHAILRTLCVRRKSIQLRDYLMALPHSISRQQALADLKTVPGLRRRGHGRGAVWISKQSRE